MNKLLKGLDLYCQINRLTVNTEKTKIVIFRKGGYGPGKYNFYFKQERLEIVKSYKYVGIELFHSGLPDFTCKRILSKVRTAEGAVLALVRRLKIDSWSQTKILFDALIRSILLYAASTWSLRVLDKIETVLTSFLKRLLSLPHNTPACFVRLETGVPRVGLQIFKELLSWIAKVKEMGDGRYPKICLQRLLNLYERFPSCDSRFNWARQLEVTFLDRIGVRVQDVYRNIQSHQYREFLVEKMRRSYITEDLLNEAPNPFSLRA